jgi:hypothetical protein
LEDRLHGLPALRAQIALLSIATFDFVPVTGRIWDCGGPARDAELVCHDQGRTVVDRRQTVGRGQFPGGWDNSFPSVPRQAKTGCGGIADARGNSRCVTAGPAQEGGRNGMISLDIALGE